MPANNKNSRLSAGIHSLAYLGVNPSTPPQLVTNPQAPTPQDYQNFYIGCIWLVDDTQQVWILVSLSQTNPDGRALWIELTAGSANDFVTNNGIATPTGGILNVLGGSNITTTAQIGPPNTIEISLLDDVVIASTLTVSALGAGNVYTDSNGLFHSSLGTNNQFLMTYGGAPIWANITAANGSIAVTGTPTGVTIAATGGGIEGIGSMPTNNGVAANIDGTMLVYGDLVTTATTALISSTVPYVGQPEILIQLQDSSTSGQLLISGGTGLAGGVKWASLTSSDSSVTITPGVNTINLQATGGGGGGGGAVNFITNSGTATISSGSISIFGDTVLTTTKATGTGTHVVEVDIKNGTKGQIMMSGTSAPIWGTLVDGSNITITTTTSGQIEIASSGGAGGITLFPTDNGSAAPTAGKLYIYGQTANTTGGAYNNIVTYRGTTSTTNDTVFIDLTQWITLPATNVGATSGGLSIAGASDIATFLHSYGTATNFSNINTFIGPRSGGTTAGVINPLTFGTAVNNTAVGGNTLNSLTTGNNNTVAGYDTGTAISSGIDNCLFGSLSGNSLTTGSGNCYFGYNSGTSAETSSDNSAFGFGAAQSITTGNLNAIFGYLSGENITTGTQNCFFGAGAGQNCETGNDNVNIGLDAGLANLTGSNNVNIGYYAGNANIVSSNVNIGFEAAELASTSIDNVIVGCQAAAAMTTVSNNNVIIGFQAALHMTASSSNNIVIGYQAGLNWT